MSRPPGSQATDFLAQLETHAVIREQTPMGGPACGLWIPDGTLSVAEAAADRMIRWIELPTTTEPESIHNDPRGRRTKRMRTGTTRRGRSPRAGDFSVQDTRAINGRIYELGSPLYCSPTGGVEVLSDGEVAEMLAAFGFLPDPVSWSLGSFVNSDDAHHQLADIAAHMAEQTGGVIDFGTFLEAAIELPGIVYVLGSTGRQGRTLLDAVAMRGAQGAASVRRVPGC